MKFYTNKDYEAYKESYEYWLLPGEKKYNIFKYLKDKISDRVTHLRCKYYGHKWISELDISPDSGSECISCTTCGKSHSHIYY